MKDVFADAQYFIALLNRRDQFHTDAVAAPVAGTRIITTQWILIETADALSHPSSRQTAERFIRSLISNSDSVVLSDLDWLIAGLDLYAKRADKEWSLTDCISFCVMEARGIREALTGDHHFEQAGYVALLADNA
jgi:uncharacterized protein